ncbi:hypothetical protein JBL43_09065 [Aureibaculum sp. A20]|uniref:Uncharacterized protein n=1 Tax=Aureibaculum flavum TaxID=2795986 RepID=A0ABS0WQY1_9FLAO|nr:hypothetical protein [Aureibaculum flavum]MBJ2174385.1 hypothetical protein [Aureibaculum flavum]
MKKYVTAMTSKKFMLCILLFSFIFSATSQRRRGIIFNKKKKKKPLTEQVAVYTGKIWEHPTRSGSISYEVNGIQALFQKMNNYNKKDKTIFRAIVNNIDPKTGTKRNLNNDIYIEFYGPCAQQINLIGGLNFDRSTIIDDFKQSKNVEDLPIHDLLAAITKGFKAQCESLEAIIIKFNVYSNGETIEYAGTLDNSNNWKLKNGVDTTNDYYTINIDAKEPKSDSEKYFYPDTKLLTVKYSGPCEINPTLAIIPTFIDYKQNQNYQRSENLLNFKAAANDAIKQYRKQCPDVEEIKFTLAYMPADYTCKEGTDCMIKASKATNWKIDNSDFSYALYDGPILDSYTEVMDHLERKDFEPLEHYSPLFKTFYIDYLVAYGDNCKSFLKEPWKITTVTYRQHYDSNGFKSHIDDVGPPVDVFIEKKYLSTYKAFEKDYALNMLSKIFTGNVRNTVNQMKNSAMYRYKAIQFLEGQISGKCNSPKIQGLYKTMQELAETMK